MLLHLTIRMLRTIGWATLLCSLVGASGALVRLLPWLVASDVPLRVSLAFFGSLLFASTEVALLVGAPMGGSLEASRWVADGTASTLRALGTSPWRQASNAAAAAFMAGLLCLLAATRSGHLANAPGSLSNQLLRTARAAACRSDHPARVPPLGVAWLCSHGQSRVVGRVPAHGPANMAWTADDARVDARLDRIELRDVRWAVRKPDVVVHVQRVEITGFVPGLMPSSVPPLLRGATAALGAWLTTVACVWALLRWPSPSRARALVVSVAGVIGLLCLWPVWSRGLYYWIAPLGIALAGILPALALARLTRPRLPKVSAGGTTHDGDSKDP